MLRWIGNHTAWLAILLRTLRSVSGHRLVDEAGAVAFFTTLAIVPALTALVSLYGLFADPAAIADHLARLAGLLPADGMRIIEEQVRRLAARERSTLGVGAILGLIAALWTANRAMKALFKALNTVHGTREGRGFVRRTLLTLTFTLGGILFVLLAIGTVVVLPVALRILGLGGFADLLLRVLRWPLLFGAVALFLACLYRVAPCGGAKRWRWVSWGGVAASLTWLLGSVALSWYLDEVHRGDHVYGPLGTVAGFLIWLWLSAAVVLIGGALNAEIGRDAGGTMDDPA